MVIFGSVANVPACYVSYCLVSLTRRQSVSDSSSDRRGHQKWGLMPVSVVSCDGCPLSQDGRWSTRCSTAAASTRLNTPGKGIGTFYPLSREPAGSAWETMNRLLRQAAVESRGPLCLGTRRKTCLIDAIRRDFQLVYIYDSSWLP